MKIFGRNLCWADIVGSLAVTMAVCLAIVTGTALAFVLTTELGWLVLAIIAAFIFIWRVVVKKMFKESCYDPDFLK